MGWMNGSILLEKIVSSLEEHVSDPSERIKVYLDLIELFPKFGCDDLEEVSSKSFNDVLCSLNGFLAGKYNRPRVLPSFISMTTTAQTKWFQDYDEGEKERLENE